MLLALAADFLEIFFCRGMLERKDGDIVIVDGLYRIACRQMGFHIVARLSA